LKLTIAYDGAGLAGWQSQPGGNTVQDLLEAAIAETAKQPARIHGSGRTDAGVHALAQVAHFDVPEGLTMNPFNWVPALNTKLPAAVRVLGCEEVAADFHARYSASGKTYRYELSTEPVLSPFRAGRAWHLPRQLDPYTLREALGLFEGRHDFEAFGARRGYETEETSFVRTVTRVALEETGWGWRLRFSGEGFLYKMVRLMTGAAVQAAQGRLGLEPLAGLLDQPAGLPRGKSPACAPPDGLFLESVDYGGPTA
jgi:tRNA pseudouridine38-40 synthase